MTEEVSYKVKATRDALDIIAEDEAPAKPRINAGLEKARAKFPKGNREADKGTRNAASRSIKYYWIAMKACSFKEWEAIIRRAVTDALDGDRFARSFLADYLMGPPVKRSEITGKDGGPIQLSNADMTEEQRLTRINALLEAAVAKKEQETVIIVDP